MRETVFMPRWTLKRFVSWIKQDLGISCCRETVRKSVVGQTCDYCLVTSYAIVRDIRG